MIYFNVTALNKQTNETEFIRIRTNGLQFWSYDEDDGRWVNPYFNIKSKRQLFDAVLNLTTILDAPSNIMTGENNKFLISVLSTDL